MKKIENYLKRNPALKVTKIEKLSGCPKRAIAKALIDGPNYRPIPSEYVWAIVSILCRYGFTVGGAILEYDKDIDTFFTTRVISEEGVEHEFHIEYHQMVEKLIIDQPFELLDLLKD